MTHLRVHLAAIFLITFSSMLSLQSEAFADENRPLYLGITETSSGAFQLVWSMPTAVADINRPDISLPDGCVWNDGALTKRLVQESGTYTFACQTPVFGRPLAIAYPRYNPSISTIIRFKPASGGDYIGVLTPADTTWIFPAAESGASVAIQYTRLGMTHIWDGKDHLLFLACLIWIAGNVKRVLITVTGFTLAHSVTLALSAFEIIRLPIPPVEAAIALSIVFLAREIALDRKDSLTWRHPIAVSSSFGLLHGLGFAAVLGEIGLPQTQAITGLLFFNIGVEAGQVVFVLAVAAVLFVWKRAAADRFFLAHPPLSRVLDANGKYAGYVIGVIAAYWMIERTLSFTA